MDFVDNFLDIRVGMDLSNYADALDRERQKIQVFQRELPLCLELVTRAIDSCRQQLSGVSTESSEHTSSDRPVLEEFIPINKPSVNSHFEIEEDEQSKPGKIELGRSDWLKSAQLWNQSPDPPITEDVAKETTSSVVEVKKNGGGGAFQPFEKTTPMKTDSAVVVGKTAGSSPIPEATTSSTAETASKCGGGTSKREDKESQTQRKQRRCWSSELHRRFVHALQQLGGPHVATPKQIRELMKVDGLTNDEVKSHLQKYRLHARRPTNSAMQDSGSGRSSTQQFVVVGSIWVPPPPPPKYTVATTRNGIYAPVATAIGRPKTAEEGKVASHSGGMVHSNSPATSSCTHTTTNSPSAA